MNTEKPKYQIRIDQISRYDWKATVADLTVEPPSATSIVGKSLHELMAKVLVAVTLRDVNAGIPEGAEAKSGVTNGTAPKPIILAPSRRIVPPS